MAIMFLTRVARQFTLRLALFAVLLGALMPTLSHALRVGGGNALIEVCSALGDKWIANDGATTPDDSTPASAGGMEHCPYCVLQAHVPGLPPAFELTTVVTALQFAVPPLFLHAPLTLHAWTTAQPRAPPLAT
jgi:hypothetical protein